MEYIDSNSKLLKLVAVTSLPVVIIGYADWCPFSILGRIVFESVEQHFPNILFAKLRTDQFFDKDIILPIGSIPTFFFFSNGNIVNIMEGFCSYESLYYEVQNFTQKINTIISEYTPVIDHEINIAIPKNLERWKSKSIVEIIDVKNGIINKIYLDRAKTQMLLFIYVAIKCEYHNNLIKDDCLTKKGATVLKKMKSDFGLKETALENLDGNSKNMFSKRASDLNRQLRCLGYKIIKFNDSEGEYEISSKVAIRVSFND